MSFKLTTCWLLANYEVHVTLMLGIEPIICGKTFGSFHDLISTPPSSNNIIILMETTPILLWIQHSLHHMWFHARNHNTLTLLVICCHSLGVWLHQSSWLYHYLGWLLSRLPNHARFSHPTIMVYLTTSSNWHPPHCYVIW